VVENGTVSTKSADEHPQYVHQDEQIDLRDCAVIPTFAQEIFMDVEKISVVRKKVASCMNLERVDLMKRYELVPSGLSPWECVLFLGGLQDALLSLDVRFFLFIR
jgi:hypothetical protein